MVANVNNKLVVKDISHPFKVFAVANYLNGCSPNEIFRYRNLRVGSFLILDVHGLKFPLLRGSEASVVFKFIGCMYVCSSM